MLSVLIPTYNYPSLKLVEEIHNQCLELNIVFEILVSEDGGDQFLDSNRKINELKNASYIEQKINIGRARNKNLLLYQSKFDLKLLLDSDVIPLTKGFIKKYLDFSKKHFCFACFGGLTYEPKSTLKHNLRYKYGIKRESKDANTRNKNRYSLFLTSNTLLKNCNQNFEDKITQYGFEEIVFAEGLKTKKIPVFHLDNAVIHENLESNEDFINKAKQGLKTLIFLEKNNIIEKGKIKLSKLYHRISKLYLTPVFKGLFQISENLMLKQLQKKGGPLWLFDIYRLLYFNKNY